LSLPVRAKQKNTGQKPVFSIFRSAACDQRRDTGDQTALSAIEGTLRDRPRSTRAQRRVSNAST
jgi:hypothetical protein